MSMSPRKPPISGPKMNPSPNAAPIIPNAPARFSGGVTSAMYDDATVMLAPLKPLIARVTNSIGRFHAIAIAK